MCEREGGGEKRSKRGAMRNMKTSLEEGEREKGDYSLWHEDQSRRYSSSIITSVSAAWMTV